MFKWKLIIHDFVMHRQPQTVIEEHIIEAPTAHDAITIGMVRHKFPSEILQGFGYPDGPSRRGLVDILFVPEEKNEQTKT